MDALARHGRPGNVRELRNEMRDLAATVEDRVVEPWHLGARLAGAGEPAPPPPRLVPSPRSCAISRRVACSPTARLSRPHLLVVLHRDAGRDAIALTRAAAFLGRFRALRDP
jgi:DNA-binding NtrC family response regulator